MKKQLVIFGIVAIFVCVGLSGCTNEENTNDKENDSDESIITLAPSYDFYVENLDKECDSVDYHEIFLKIRNCLLLSTPVDSISCLTFDLSEISLNATVKVATLKMYKTDKDIFGSSTNKTIKVHECRYGYDSYCMNWSRKPYYKENYSDSVTTGDNTSEWYSWNVTEYVQNGLQHERVILVLDTSSYDAEVVFYSSDVGANEMARAWEYDDKYPQLVIELV
jgi:hypothetical protein